MVALTAHLQTCQNSTITITTANYLDSAFGDMKGQFTQMGTEETYSYH
jgi:hypothetical protein